MASSPVPHPILPDPSAARRRLAAAGSLAASDDTGVVDLEDQALWGVSESATGHVWRLRDCPLSEVQALAAAHALPELVARLLVLRGVTADQAALYLHPTLKDLLPDPDTLQDMQVAVARIVKAVQSREKVCVFADYDVDGGTSAALMLRLLRALGLEPDLYVPDRVKEGYGPNGPALREIAKTGVSLVITLDCGATAVEALEEGARAGLDVVVIDHHLVEGELPRAVGIVNPNRPDDISGLGTLAAVGVTFVVSVGVLRALRLEGWFDKAGVAMPDLRHWLDLVALGTVCDVVPLTGLNRAFVVQGLKIMAGQIAPGAQPPFPGLAALAQVTSLTEPPGTYHLGFILGPRINAGGRVGRADLGARLLSTTDAEEALTLARELDAFNGQRRDIEAAVLDDAIGQAEAALETWPGRPVLMVHGEGWHPGVIGIVAGRLKERFKRPTLALALDGDTATGSGRSVTGVDLGAAILEARDQGLLLKGGGHAMAAGLTVAVDCLDVLDRFLTDRLGNAVAEARADTSLWVDATIALSGATRSLYETLEATGPFGAGSPEPLVALRDAQIDWVQVVGEAHLRVTLASPEGAKLTAMAFRAVDTDLGRLLMEASGSAVHITGHLRADNYKGRNGVQLHIVDAAPA